MSESGIIRAEQRVREMNRVTRRYSEQGNDFIRQSSQSRRDTQPQQQPRFEPAANGAAADRFSGPHVKENPRTSAAPAAGSVTEVFGYDGEKLLLLFILLVLIKEKADVKLLLALAYILL